LLGVDKIKYHVYLTPVIFAPSYFAVITSSDSKHALLHHIVYYTPAITPNNIDSSPAPENRPLGCFHAALNDTDNPVYIASFSLAYLSPLLTQLFKSLTSAM
jgi:hypothetical protein